MTLWRAVRRQPETTVARTLYGRVVGQARDPRFFASCGVPDTVDGRFEIIVLHAHLLLRRLAAERNPALATLSQELFDLMFADMDQSLREMGVGDLSVGKKVRTMAEAFYGRAAAYDTGLRGDDATLESALRRNLYGTVEPPADAVEAMTAYVRREGQRLAEQPAPALLGGDVTFGPPPEIQAA